MKIRNTQQRFHNASKFLLLFLMISTLSGCKQALQVSKTAYIIGNNDIVRLEESKVEESTVEIADSSVLISTLVSNKKRKFCTGTLIKPMGDQKLLRVLTNHHCFANVDEQGNVDKELLKDACTGTQIYLGFRAGETDSSTSSSCLAGSLRTDPRGDLAVFTVASQLPTKYTPLAIWPDGSVPAGRPAMIVHYPDVDENFMQVTGSRSKLPVASITDVDCSTQGNFPENEWRFDPSLPYSMKHNCDLLHGSSGSALIDKESRTIIGVNWGGIKIDYKKNIETINVATRADYVQAFLDQKSDEWQPQAGSNLANNSAQSGTKQRSESNSSSGSIISCGTIGAGASSFARLAALLLLIAPIAIINLKAKRREE
jgi:hypothetical protein